MTAMDFLPIPEGAEPQMSDGPVQAVSTEIRVLTPEEMKELQPVFGRAGADVPDPSVGFIVGLVEDGKPTESFITVQGVVHAEPLNLEPRHRMFLKSLAHAAEREIVSRIGICNVFLFAPPGDVKQLAEAFGMREEPWAVMSKVVGPTGEPS